MKTPNFIKNKATKFMSNIVEKVSDEIFSMMKVCHRDMNISIDDIINDSEDYDTFMYVLNLYYKDYNERKEKD